MKLRNKLLSLALIATVAATSIASDHTTANQRQQAREDAYNNPLLLMSAASGVVGLVLAAGLSEYTYVDTCGKERKSFNPAKALMAYAATQYVGWKILCATTGEDYSGGLYFAAHLAFQALVGTMAYRTELMAMVQNYMKRK